MSAAREPRRDPASDAAPVAARDATPLGELVDRLSAAAFGAEVADAVARGGTTPFAGSAGSLPSLVAADLARRSLARPVASDAAFCDAVIASSHCFVAPYARASRFGGL